MLCPLCGERKARRTCPAVGRQICTVCCGTKRLKQIQCPSDCSYLTASREHPAAVLVRRQQRDLETIVPFMHDLNGRQSQLFFLVGTFFVRYESPELQPLIDEDITEATAALAATFETASRGVIYDHRPASLPAERLVSGLKPLLAEAAAGGGGSAFERDAAVVLRRIEGASRALRDKDPSRRGAFLELLGRLMRPDAAGPPSPATAPTRLIVP